MDLQLTAIRTLPPHNKVENITHFKFSNGLIKTSYEVVQFLEINSNIDIYYFDKNQTKQFIELSVPQGETIPFPKTFGIGNYFLTINPFTDHDYFPYESELADYRFPDPLLELPTF